MKIKNTFFASFTVGMKLFGENIAVLVNTTLLVFVYFIGIGITSMVAKIMAKKFLLQSQKKTYWQRASYSKKKEDYYRQF